MPPRKRIAKPQPVHFFVSYSHMDAVWFQKLRPVLKFSTPNTSVAHVWHDQKLEAGHRWHDEIQSALKQMAVFVCLVSYDFLASDYIMQEELPVAIQREKRNEVIIVPIHLYPVSLDKDCPALKPFNHLPAWGKCWRDYEQNGGHYQDAHKPIRDGFWQAIHRVQAARAAAGTP